MSNDREIRELFQNAGVGLSQDDVWKVQSSWVVKHKALERLAAGIGIKFDAPQVLRAERDEAVILVVGHKGDACEWSIGEALVNQNYRVSGKMAPYVYAMAEKRAKDRVIIKLAGLHGVYSEDEADDFQPPARAIPTPPKPPAAHMGKFTDEESHLARDMLISALNMAQTIDDLAKWQADNMATIGKLLEEDRLAVREAYGDIRQALQGREAAE